MIVLALVVTLILFYTQTIRASDFGRKRFALEPDSEKGGGSSLLLTKERFLSLLPKEETTWSAVKSFSEFVKHVSEGQRQVAETQCVVTAARCLEGSSSNSGGPRVNSSRGWVDVACQTDDALLRTVAEADRLGDVRYLSADGKMLDSATHLGWSVRQTQAAYPYLKIHINVRLQVDVKSVERPSCGCGNPCLPLWEMLEPTRVQEQWCEAPESWASVCQGFPLPKRQKCSQLKISPLPLGKGSHHVVLHAAYHGDRSVTSRIVVKKPSVEVCAQLSNGAKIARMERNAIMLALAGSFNDTIKQFSDQLPPGWKKLRIVKEVHVEILDAHKSQYILEDFLGWQFEKIGSGGVYSDKMPSDGKDLLEAFSHWTYLKSGGLLMVVKPEVIVADGIYWIRRATLCYGLMGWDSKNLGSNSNDHIGNFLNTHKCNRFCSMLGVHSESGSSKLTYLRGQLQQAMKSFARCMHHPHQ